VAQPLAREARVQLDYSGIVSAYDDAYTSFVESRRGFPRSQHRLSESSPRDKERLKSEVREMPTRAQVPVVVSWSTLFQSVIDCHTDRFEGLRYALRHSEHAPRETCAGYATISILHRDRLTKQEKLLVKIIVGVHGEICSI
jgi:hypothetical protein